MNDEEQLRRSIEEHLETAEELIQQGQRQQAFLEFEKAATQLESAEKYAQLEQLWGHAATGFTAAQAPLQAGYSYSRLASLEMKARRQQEARDSFLAAANSFFAVREKNQEVWLSITQAVEKAIDLSITLGEISMAIELLFKNATIHQRETGFILDAINSLEQAQHLLEKEPNHPLTAEIAEKLQELIDYQ
ncbi:MAG: hypothetical protein ACFFCF_00970 [Promethearchaeota archaeon]